ncbi:hypothetical protein [Sphingomonas montanisoli]|nr:hypothetical protein [Sphingomonas montanisoli]
MINGKDWGVRAQAKTMRAEAVAVVSVIGTIAVAGLLMLIAYF